MIQVLKRDGQLENLDIEKLHKVVFLLVKVLQV